MTNKINKQSALPSVFASREFVSETFGVDAFITHNYAQISQNSIVIYIVAKLPVIDTKDFCII